MAQFPALPLFTDAYMADTRHLSTLQHGAYLLMLMTAWRMPDCALPDDDIFLARICGLDKRTWTNNKGILLSFWKKNDEHKWYQGRLKDERNYVAQLANKNSIAGKASALKRLNRGSTNVQPKSNVNPTPTPTPIPISKKESKSSGTRFALASLPEEWKLYAIGKRPDLDHQEIFSLFKDYWSALPGAKGRKLDWFATWRIWLSRQDKPKTFKGEVHATIRSTAQDAANRVRAELGIKQ